MFCAQRADIWSCGVILYVMLVGAYPFEDPNDPKNFGKTIQRIINVRYTIPPYVFLSRECRSLLSRILVANPAKRYTIQEITNHPWFLKKLRRETMVRTEEWNYPQQPVEEIMRILEEARKPPPKQNIVDPFAWYDYEQENEEEEYYDAEEYFY
eukprot:TRINITY_DN2980_c0_g1_i1.p3 TRINITY_DN2980_c0_g1~~TRINITY_DN2980_c0_g1_i1.p3  ORF type:complete len:154 (-),score=16.14 TRINITY_DN2980_c0_g1_i1:512-973(-)